MLCDGGSVGFGVSNLNPDFNVNEAGRLWTSSLTSLSLSFHACEVKMMMAALGIIGEPKQVYLQGTGQQPKLTGNSYLDA